MDSRYMIRPVGAKDLVLSDALDLVWRVFLRYEAPEYTEQGIDEFKRYIEPDVVRQKLASGVLLVWACFDGGKVVGVVAVRPPCHISLLFVDENYHRQGIARALYGAVIKCYKQSDAPLTVTVNSSPYAEKAYKRLGFVPTDTEKTVKGIRFIPMRHIVE